jgi:hypothetical protein
MSNVNTLILNRSTQRAQSIRRRGKTILFAGVFVLLVLVGLVGMFLAYKARTTIVHVRDVQATLAQIEISVLEKDIALLPRHLHELQANLYIVQQDLESFRFARINHHIDRQFQVTETLLANAIQVSATGNELLRVFAPALEIINPDNEVSYNTLTEEQKQQLLVLLNDVRPAIIDAHATISDAKDEIASLSSFGVAAPLNDIRVSTLQQITTLEEIASAAKLASQVVPEFVGTTEEKTYLILFQNNWELRPAGGFIGTYGILTLKNGEIVHFETDDIYQLDNASNISVTPPWQLQEYLLIDKLFLRDSNWDPDFTIAAAVAEDFYKKENGQKADQLAGVISITPHVIEQLLTLIGPITVEGYPYTFTSENVTYQIEWLVQRDFAPLNIPREIRKDIVGHVGEVIIEKITQLERDQFGAFASIILQELDQKHIMLYSHNPHVQRVMEEKNWAGQMHQTDSDYLMIVDANLIGYKSDAVLERHVTYEVNAMNLDDVRVRATMHYNHPGVHDWKTTRYQTWTRFYVPEGSEFIGIEGQDEQDGHEVEITQEYGKTVFGVLKRIPTQSQETLTMEYRLPSRIATQIKQGKYELLIQKQLGTVDHGLDVQLVFDKQGSSVSPQHLLSRFYNNTIEYTTDLVIDRLFQVEFL